MKQQAARLEIAAEHEAQVEKVHLVQTTMESTTPKDEGESGTHPGALQHDIELLAQKEQVLEKALEKITKLEEVTIQLQDALDKQANLISSEETEITNLVANLNTKDKKDKTFKDKLQMKVLRGMGSREEAEPGANPSSNNGKIMVAVADHNLKSDKPDLSQLASKVQTLETLINTLANKLEEQKLESQEAGPESQGVSQQTSQLVRN